MVHSAHADDAWSRRQWALASVAGLAALASPRISPAQGLGTDPNPKPGSPPAPGRPLQVVASFSILADLVRQLAGASAEVTSLTGAGGDPHAYTPAPSDVQRVAKADLVVVNGLGFEGWLDRLVANAGVQGRVLVASTGVDVRHIGRLADPHAWQSARQAQHYVNSLEAGLLEALAHGSGTTAPAVVTPAATAQQAEIRHRAGHLRDQLRQLDQQVRAGLEAIPPDGRRAITLHGAFGYFGRDYGVTLTSLLGVAPEAEASAAQLARAVRQVRAQGAVALFAEAGSNPRVLQRVADEAGVAIGGTLYADALSRAGGSADTYLRLLAHNAQTITQGLKQGHARVMSSSRTSTEPAR